MRSLRVLLALWIVILAVDLSPFSAYRAAASEQGALSPPAIVPGQLLLGFAPGFGESARDDLIAAHGGETLTRLDTLDARVVSVRGARPLGEVARSFVASGGVRYAEPNAIAQVAAAPNDPRLGDQWALRKIGVIDGDGNWTVPPGDRSIVVGIVDSGVNYDHPDLAANMWSAPTGWSVQGCTANSHGYRATGETTNCDPRDDLGTGTPIAGVVGATGNNGIGISGVNQQVSIMALKCVDNNGFIQVADAVRVIEYAIAAKQADVDLRVLTIGWTMRSPSQPLKEAIEAAGAAGILVVAAAGDVGDNNDSTPNYPASFGAAPHNLANVIAVMASDSTDSRVVGMNYGPTSVHLAAPGVAVLTTTNGGANYGDKRSSALAAGYVGGTAAVAVAAAPNHALNVAALRSRLLGCGDLLVDLADSTITGRRLNAKRTIENTDCDFTLTTTVQDGPDRGQILVTPGAATYRSGTMVSLTTRPAEGYQFDSWLIDERVVDRSSTLTLTIDADRRVTARFTRLQYLLTVKIEGRGDVAITSPAPATSYESGTTVQLIATPVAGFRFVGWALNGQPAGSDPLLTIVMDRNYVAEAGFAPVAVSSPAPSYPLALTATAGGSALAVPGGGSYAPGTRVALSATPEQGYVFTGWTIDDLPAGRANPYTITMTGERRAIANFAPAQSLLLSYTSGGRVDATAATWTGDSPYPLGTVVTLTATTASNGIFTGWTIDGAFVGWANPLTITMDRTHTVVATFAARPRFDDLPPGPPPYEATTQLAARGIINGYGDGTFGPGDTTTRAQMAALIVRAMGWGEGNPDNPFSDRDGIDDDLWRSIAILAAYGVARGYGDGTFGTRDPVLKVQTVAFITRAMVRAGRWEWQPDNPALFPQITAHRDDLSTYVHYAGLPHNAESTETWSTWDAPATRGWFAQALWQALDRHFGVDRVP